MIVRMHRLAPAIICVLVMLMGLTFAIVAAQQPVQITNVEPPVTKAEMYVTIAGVLTFCLLAGAGLIAFVLAHDRSSVRTMLQDFKHDLEAAKSTFYNAVHSHNEAPDAHFVASKENHGPMNARLSALEEDLRDALLNCEAVKCGLIEPRAKRRSTDPQTGGPNDSGPDFTDASERAKVKAAMITYPRRDIEGHRG